MTYMITGNLLGENYFLAEMDYFVKYRMTKEKHKKY